LTLVAVAWPLPGEYVAFQPLVMVCPDARLNLSDQPLIADEPVLVMVMLSVRPVFHALTELVTRQAPPPWFGGEVVFVGGPVVGWVGPLVASLTVMLELPLLWYPSVAMIW
jgi:hypothetical protein